MQTPLPRWMAIVALVLLLPVCSGDGPSQVPDTPPVEEDSQYISLDVHRSSLDIRCAIYAENIDPSNPDELMAFGTNGRALHYRGNHWARPIFLGTRADVLAVSSISMSHFFAGGSQEGGSALLLEYTGDGWEHRESTVAGNITGMDRNYFVTDQGAVYRAISGGSPELRFQAPEGVRFRDLLSMYPSGDVALVVVGAGGVIYYWNSTDAEWVDQSIEGGPDFAALTIAPSLDSSPYAAYAAGDDEIWEFQYGSWEKVYDFAPGAINDITFRPIDQIPYAVGDGGLLLHRDEDGWWDEIIDPDVDLRRIAITNIGAEDENVMSLCGEGGHVYVDTPSGWTDVSQAAEHDWKAVVCASDLHNYAASGNVLYSLVGDIWTETGSWNMGATIDAFTVLSDGDIWALGSMPDGLDHFVLHYDGGDWSIMKQVSWDRFTGIWSDPAGEHIFVADSSGLIWHRQEESWGLEPELVLPAGIAINDLGGSSPTDLVAVGDEGNIYRRSAAGWTQEAAGTTGNLNAVDGAVIAGDAGLILVHDGSTWQRVTTSVDEDLRDVYAGAADNVWIVGDDATMIHFDGSSWRRQITHLPGIDFLAAAPDATGKIWIGASERYLMRTP